MQELVQVLDRLVHDDVLVSVDELAYDVEVAGVDGGFREDAEYDLAPVSHGRVPELSSGRPPARRSIQADSVENPIAADDLLPVLTDGVLAGHGCGFPPVMEGFDRCRIRIEDG